jgi:hypothetical protein
MEERSPTVISASRRTDIPAFYMDDFMRRVDRGYFEVINPYNQKKREVSAKPGDVHTLVFWSKNYGPFLDKGYGDELKSRGYHLFFNFTLNSETRLLEPMMPSLDHRLEQMEALCSRFGPASVVWRFDPICFYTGKDGGIKNNLADFSIIADKAEAWGIKRCITSFLDIYPKIKQRTAHMPGFAFVDPDMTEKISVVLKLESCLIEKNMELFLCCEKEVMDLLPEISTVKSASCVPNFLLMEMFGGKLSLQKDYGQRIKNGCGCRTSVDIGSYKREPCGHHCLYCYANPGWPRKAGK